MRPGSLSVPFSPLPSLLCLPRIRQRKKGAVLSLLSAERRDASRGGGRDSFPPSSGGERPRLSGWEKETTSARGWRRRR